MRVFIAAVLGSVALMGLQAQANSFVSTCQLSGRIELSENTDFHCTEAGKDFVIAPHTLIVTNGFALTIFTLNNIQLDVTIRAFDGIQSVASADAGPISIAALSVDGRLEIFNDGWGEQGQSGDVSLKFLSATQEFKDRVIVKVDDSEATVRVEIQNQG